MKKVKNNNFNIYVILTILVFGITIFYLITSGYVTEGYNLEVNSVSDRRIKATRLIENKVATEKLRVEAEETVTARFKAEPQAEEKIIKNLDKYFEETYMLRGKNTPIFIPERDETDFGESQGEGAADLEGDLNTAEQNSEKEQEIANTSALMHEVTMRKAIEASPINEIFGYEDILYIINLDMPVYEGLKESIYKIVEETLEAGIKEESLSKTLVDVNNEFEKLYQGQDIALAEEGYEICAQYLVPNLIYDEEATLKLKAERRDAVAPVYYLAGQMIVDDGEIISEEAFSALDSLGLISKGLAESIIPIIGVVGITVCIFCFGYLYIYYFYERIIQIRKEGYLLFTLYVVVITIAKLLAPSMPWIFVPLMAFTMLVSVLIDSRLAIVLNIAIAIITMLITNTGIDYLVFNITIGTITALVSRFANQRKNIFLISIIISVASAFLYAAMSFVIEKSISQQLFTWTIYAFLNGFLTVMLCMGSLPLWEAVFSVVTPIKLLDLTNPNNEFLRRLTIEAPGTYHHSLIVANLAETAAFDIGADANLARVGGYYHDIGKLKYPQYFSENQVGINLHDDLDPYSSAQIISSHVSIGLEMAEDKKLPKVIKDIIAQHHGNTLIKYFFYRAKERHPDEEINENDFRYNQPIPQSKEAAVVMLADTVEAAVRSMISKSKSMDEVEEIIKVLVKDKLDDGQLIDSSFTIKDIDTISKSFMQVFKGMYHERIAYPKASDFQDGSKAGKAEIEVIEDKGVLAMETDKPKSKKSGA